MSTKTLISSKKSTIEKIIFIALCILLFYPPYMRGLYFNKELLSTHIFSFILISIWLGFKIKNRDYKIISSYTDLLAFSIAILYFISIFYGVNKRLAIGEFLKYSNYLFIYLLAKELGQNFQYYKGLLNILLLSAFGVAIVGIGSAIGSWEYNGAYVWDRINSTLQYPNALAAYMGAMFFISIGLSLTTDKSILKIVYSALSSIFIFTLILTFSRGMWLLMPILMLIYIFIIPKKEKVFTFITVIANSISGIAFAAIFQKSLKNPLQIKLWAIFFTMICTAGAVAYILNRYKEQIGKINYKILYSILITVIVVGFALSMIIFNDIKNIDGDLQNAQTSIITQKLFKVLPDSITWRLKGINMKDTSVEGRISFYKDAFKIVKDYPILGTGGGGWSTLYFMYQSYLYWTKQAHNYFLQVWIEIGTIGITLFMAFIFSIIKAYYKVQRNLDNYRKIVISSILMTILTFLIHAILDFDLSLSALSIILWTLIGMLVSENNDVKVLKINNKNISYTLLTLSIVLVLVSTSLSLGMSNADKAIKAAKSKDVEKSIKYFEKASIFDPFTASYKADLSSLYRSKAKDNKDYIEKSIEYIDKAIKLSPYEPKILGKAASIYLSKGKLDKAKEFTDKIVEVQPMRAENYQIKSEFYYKVAVHLIKKNNIKKAKNYLDELINIEQEFETISQKSLKPMEMTEKTKEYIQQGKKIKQAIETKK